MFENLRDAFSSATKSFSEKELKEKDIEEILFQLEISLLESDVASEVIDSIKSDLKEKLIGTKVDKKGIEKFVKDSLIQSISSLFDDAKKIDLFSNIDSKKEAGEPYLILFVGINGVGKTTTLAKLAYLLQQSKYSVVVAAADTFRAGAIEQLREHTNRLNLKIVAQNYGSDPAAVARDAVLYAKSHKIDCVLIDTAGRMQTSKNLMDQIEKITNVVKPDFKIFVGDSLAGNDTVNQAKEFHESTKFDAAILTKSDADARGGAALSIVKTTAAPVLYVGVGQEYPDLKAFDKELFLETVFGKTQTSQTIIPEKKEVEPEQKQEISESPQEEKIPESESQLEKNNQSLMIQIHLKELILLTLTNMLTCMMNLLQKMINKQKNYLPK
jgi:fused signal recognition particle receptor